MLRIFRKKIYCWYKRGMRKSPRLSFPLSPSPIFANFVYFKDKTKGYNIEQLLDYQIILFLLVMTFRCYPPPLPLCHQSFSAYSFLSIPQPFKILQWLSVLQFVQVKLIHVKVNILIDTKFYSIVLYMQKINKTGDFKLNFVDKRLFHFSQQDI